MLIRKNINPILYVIEFSLIEILTNGFSAVN